MSALDFGRVNAAALTVLPSLLGRWLPDGRKQGAEWVARNPMRSDRRPGSFSVNTRTGRWADFATGDRGGDVVSLLQAWPSSNTRSSSGGSGIASSASGRACRVSRRRPWPWRTSGPASPSYSAAWAATGGSSSWSAGPPPRATGCGWRRGWAWARRRERHRRHAQPARPSVPTRGNAAVRNLSPATQQSYVYAVAKFSRFFGRSPDQLGVGEVRASGCRGRTSTRCRHVVDQPPTQRGHPSHLTPPV